ncbi:hypothetical protein FGO68_gene8011 [Halteria grandinella]|uniref:Uncharacterized protein n=1 Tax=Halteria grandinella TaxID=5974 RepID=A0A8J8TAD5_HALGN|nr:hypothetical protein FGO68_gene8011 [Halteria grandinella]
MVPLGEFVLQNVILDSIDSVIDCNFRYSHQIQTLIKHRVTLCTQQQQTLLNNFAKSLTEGLSLARQILSGNRSLCSPISTRAKRAS